MRKDLETMTRAFYRSDWQKRKRRQKAPPFASPVMRPQVMRLENCTVVARAR